MNLSVVDSIPDRSSINAMLFASNPGFATAARTPWLFDGLDNRGGVRQDPPANSNVFRRKAGLEPDPDVPDINTDEEPAPLEDE